MITVPWIDRQKTSDAPVVVMASRLQLSGRRSVPLFPYLSLGAFLQVLRAPGIVGASLRAEPLKGCSWTLSSWTDRKSIAAYSDSDPHRSTVRKLQPKMADSRFLTYEVQDKPDWTDAVRRIRAEDIAASPGAPDPVDSE
jgi:hypothetical protein